MAVLFDVTEVNHFQADKQLPRGIERTEEVLLQEVDFKN
tara:strand:- start:8970 stop:9086 length:117 start_codon:yes stop_codon:yes gene_type:complete